MPCKEKTLVWHVLIEEQTSKRKKECRNPEDERWARGKVRARLPCTCLYLRDEVLKILLRRCVPLGQRIVAILKLCSHGDEPLD